MSLINKKIKNATPTVVGDINFRSRFEAQAYKLLLEAGFIVEYEAVKIPLMTGFRPEKENYYAPEKKYRGHIVLQDKKIRDITYTPDFVVNKKYLIEIKGKENDVYAVKQKLFRRALNDLDYIFFEVRTLDQLKETIRIIEEHESL